MQRLEKYDVYPVPVDTVYFDDGFNCRNKFTPQSVKGLADHIADNGLEVPIIVQPVADMEKPVAVYQYRLVAGHRRFVAVTTFLKWTSIPANIRIGLSEREAQILNLTENLEREDLNPLEEALAIAKRFPNGCSLRAASRELQRDTRWIHQRLRLLQLPETLQQQVATGQLTLLDVEVLAQMESPGEQLRAAARIVEARAERTGGPRKLKLDAALRRKFRNRLTKSEINGWVARLMELGFDGLITRFGALCAGYISAEEFEQDIEQEISCRPPIQNSTVGIELIR